MEIWDTKKPNRHNSDTIPSIKIYRQLLLHPPVLLQQESSSSLSPMKFEFRTLAHCPESIRRDCILIMENTATRRWDPKYKMREEAKNEKKGGNTKVCCTNDVSHENSIVWKEQKQHMRRHKKNDARQKKNTATGPNDMVNKNHDVSDPQEEDHINHENDNRNHWDCDKKPEDRTMMMLRNDDDDDDVSEEATKDDDDDDDIGVVMMMRKMRTMTTTTSTTKLNPMSLARPIRVVKISW
jgi:hypothetical protein